MVYGMRIIHHPISKSNQEKILPELMLKSSFHQKDYQPSPQAHQSADSVHQLHQLQSEPQLQLSLKQTDASLNLHFPWQ